jgi:membrane protein required for beta-lactamase induction
MTKNKSGINPFYVLLVLLGIAFTLTACAYGVMAFKGARADAPVVDQSSGAALLSYLDEHGAQLMGLELALLAFCTAGAMATDRYWMRRAVEDFNKRAKPEGEASENSR